MQLHAAHTRAKSVVPYSKDVVETVLLYEESFFELAKKYEFLRAECCENVVTKAITSTEVL